MSTSAVPSFLQFASRPDDRKRLIELWTAHAQQQQALGQIEAARDSWRRLLTLAPENVTALVQLGRLLIDAQAWSDAASVYEELWRLQPQDVRLPCNLAYLYDRAGHYEAAVDRARAATRQQPQLAEAWNNLGISLRNQHRLVEAEQAFARTLECQPDHALAAFNLGTTRLLAGDYLRGWAGYELRESLQAASSLKPSLPLWDGESRATGTLVVYSDQGFGDAIQFARFLGPLRSRWDGPIQLIVQPALQRLMSVGGVADLVVTSVRDAAQTGFRLPLGSLPCVLGLARSELPGPIEWLPQAALRSEDFAAVIRSTAGGRLRVGLVWRGNPRQPLDSARSCPPEVLAPLMELAGIAWYSLQPDMDARTRDSLPQVHSLGPHFRDFADTAAALLEMDLIITVDTAVAHLAGTLMRPTWVLLSHTPDWRWGLNDTVSSWYPTLRLLRQQSPGDWTSPLREVLHGPQVAG